MNPAILNNPFMQAALPITILIAAWINSRGMDGVHKAMDRGLEGVNKRLDDVVARLGRIETAVKDHGERIAILEERTSPLVRRG